MTVRAYAKVNLTLEVLGKRQDGYHEIKTVMQSISLYDLLDIKKDSSISITTNRSYIPTDRRNLVYTACEKFFAFAGIKGGAKINIKKQIPVSAGLAFPPRFVLGVFWPTFSSGRTITGNGFCGTPRPRSRSSATSRSPPWNASGKTP